METKILIIEDDSDIRDGVRILLESEGYKVTEASNGTEGLAKLQPDTSLVILDVMMPGMSGLRVCEEIRKTSVVPILFLTAKVQESDKLIGLMAGADDYLTKPFSYAELLGRVKALIRRYTSYNEKAASEAVESPEYIEKSIFKISAKFNEVYINGKAVDMSDIEYRMFLLFVSNAGKVFSAQNLYESIWQEPYFYTCNNTVMVHIRKLRVLVEPDPQEPIYIKTVWGKGYRFEA